MKKGVQLFLVMVLFTLIAPFASKGYADEPTVTVKLTNHLDSPTELSLSIHGNYQIQEDSTFSFSSDGIYRLAITNNELTLYSGDNLHRTFGTSFTLQSVPYSTDNYITINDRRYLGDMVFTIENGESILPINKLPMEDYLKGVVPSEMAPSWNLEALKAQAVAARTYALSKAGQIIDNTTRYQAYGGDRWNPQTSLAVDETKGQVLTYNGKLIDAVYSDSNGGVIESSSDVWNSPIPYLSVKADPYDPKNPWTFTFKKVQIDLSEKDLAHPEIWWELSQEQDNGLAKRVKNWLQENGYPNTEIKIISIPYLQISDNKTLGGRSTKASIRINFIVKDAQGYRMGADGNIQQMVIDYPDVPITKLRKMLGSKVLRSYFIDSVQDDGIAYTITGRGFGHGVGMSQWGAKTMGEDGLDYKQILSFYYPGSSLAGGKPSYHLSVVSSNNLPASNQPIRVKINGLLQNYDQPPIIEHNRVLVPLRGIFEALGSNVHWDNETNSITSIKGDTKITLQIGSPSAMVNNQIIMLDVAAQLKNNRTLVPVRFISESLGAKVDWDESNQTVMIQTN